MEKPIIFTEDYHSPCGDLILGSFGDQLCLCDWLNSKQHNRTDLRLQRALKAKMKVESSAVTRKAASELDEYFHGHRKSFDLPLLFVGTPFQKKVWKTLLRVPYGEIRTYAWMAKEMGNERAVRAVGHADGCNPIVIFAPCHRVVGANGKLTGYAGGLEAKKYLLDLESKNTMDDNIRKATWTVKE